MKIRLFCLATCITILGGGLACICPRREPRHEWRWERGPRPSRW